MASTDDRESWVIGLHGDMVAKRNRKVLYEGFKELFDRNRMYTIILGAKIDKDLDHLLDDEEDKSQYYYQYGELDLNNIKFISGLLKMQKYKDTHFLFTERICE